MSVVTDQISYDDLYSRWEHGNWSVSDLDFSVDREQWLNTFTEFERRAALWTYSMFFHGEDSVADNLSPFIDAAPKEEQKYFLATQQVDEARHAVLFGRFMREVADHGEDLNTSLRATRSTLTWGFRQVFARLDKIADELRRDRSRPKLAQAIALYHLVIEGELAQPGQHFIEEGLTQRDLLPAFREGIGNVSRDEQRHIGFGVKMIADLIHEDPECAEAVAELLRDVLPYTSAVFVPPDFDERYVTVFGFTLEDMYARGAEAIEGRLRAAGLTPERLRTGFPFDLDSREIARRGLQLVRAGYLGEPNGKVTYDRETTEVLFDSIRRAVDPAVAQKARIQWEFTDAEPWYLVVDNGATTAGLGRLDNPDVTFRCRFEDWIDIAAQRVQPWRSVLLRRVRPSGNLRILARLPRMFD